MRRSAFADSMRIITTYMEEANTILLIGRPGSGKGTQAELLAKKLNWKIFSSGNQFREMRNGEGPLSERVREASDAGQLLPDWFADYLFAHGVLNLPTDEGIILEGFGRSRPQAELMHKMLSWLGRKVAVVHLTVSEDETLRRQLERAKTDPRPDSSDEEKVRARFAEYRANTEPALAYFNEAGILIEIDGEPDIDAIHQNIVAKLGFA